MCSYNYLKDYDDKRDGKLSVLMAMMYSLYCVVFLFMAAVTRFTAVKADTDFSFASYYNDHMVLQKSPMKANIWGYLRNSAVNNEVSVELNNKKYNAIYVKDNSTMYRWMVSLDPMEAGGPHVITATAGNVSITLNDVLFGDVWVCSGQSNMQFTVPSVFNASAEIAAAANYPNIRVFTASLKDSTTPQIDLLGIEEMWSVASPSSIGNGNWTYFSATCWFFGRNLYDSLKYPIGLVATDWGGTPVEAWSSPDALKKCLKKEQYSPENYEGPGEASVLWNAMIHPFLNMTIYGAIWYQGEANAGHPDTYNCTFPAMIDDWRAKWFEATNKATDDTFPFGFVQLAANGNSNTTLDGFPDIRWHQTADYGYVPNPRMKNVFMAVAMDLGDPTSPFGSVHPRDKQDVGYRLALAGRAIAYHDESLYYTGPIAKTATSAVHITDYISVMYDEVTSDGLEIRSHSGFEVCCKKNDGSLAWMEAPLFKLDKGAVIIKNPCTEVETPINVRYSWRDDPCVFKKCAVYSGDLPSPPFILPISPAP